MLRLAVANFQPDVVFEYLESLAQQLQKTGTILWLYGNACNPSIFPCVL